MEWVVRSPDGSEAGELIDYDNLVFKDVPLAPSGWTLTLPAEHAMVPVLTQNGAGICQTDTDEPYGALTGTVLPGPDEVSVHERIRTGQEDTYTFFGETDRSVLWARVALPESSQLNWDTTAAAGTAFETLWDDQFGSGGLDPSRENTVFDVTTSGASTTSITIDLPRYDMIGPNLATILAADDIAIRTTYVASSSEVRFYVEDVDTTSKPVVTVVRGTAIKETTTSTAVEASRIYCLGNGVGLNRDVEEADQSTDVWDLREAAISRQNIVGGSDILLIAEGTAQLVLGTAGVTVEIDPSVAVKSGDIVQVYDADGVTLVDRYITSITVEDNPEETVVTGTIGLSLNSSSVPSGVGTSQTPPPRIGTEAAQDYTPEELTITAATWEEYNTGAYTEPCKVVRDGRTVHLWGMIKATSNPAAAETLFTLAAEYRPADVHLTMHVANDGTQIGVEVQADGDVRVYNPGQAVGYLALQLTWIV